MLPLQYGHHLLIVLAAQGLELVKEQCDFSGPYKLLLR